MRQVFLLCMALLAGGSAAFGQYTNVLENGASQTITNGWDALGDMIVGDATPSNTLTIVSGGSLTNVNGYVGRQAGASDNTVTVSGAGAEWISTGALQVGAAGNSNNVASVSSGGVVVASNLVIAAGNDFNLNNNGTLVITGDFDATPGVGFNWESGGSLSVGGALTLDALNGSNLTLEITTGGIWDTTATNLNITGTGNTLSITNGGMVDSASAFIGNSSNDVGNTVLVDGAGSEWNLTGDLFVNSSNTLSLASTGLVSIAGNITVSNATVAGSGRVELTGGASILSVYGSQSQISTNVLFEGNGGGVAFTDSELIVDGLLSSRFNNFDQLSLTNSLLAGAGSVDSFQNVNLFGGRIAPDGELIIQGNFVPSSTLLQVTAGSDRLVVADGGAFDLSGLLAEVSITNTTVTSAFDEVILSANGLTGGFASTNFIEQFLLYDFALTDDGMEVSVVAEAAEDGDIGATLEYGGIQGVRAGFYGMQNAAFVRTKQLRRNSVATDHAISNEAYLMQTDDRPAGPQGPGDQNTIFGMHFWAEQFSGQGDYDGMSTTEGFTLNNNGTSFGFDTLLSESLVLGINYTYARSAASTSTGDRSDTETYWLGLYSEWFFKNDYYLEGLLALGWSDYETVRTEEGYTGEGKFEGFNFGGHIEGGKYFHRNNWAFAPYAGLRYLGIQSDAYTETSGGNEIAVDGQNVASLESALGLKLRNRFDIQAGRFQTVGYAEWAYDFINDEIGSSLSDGTFSVGTARIAPAASVLNAGIGLSWICTDYLEVGFGYDGRFNENYEEHIGSIMLDIRF